MRLHFRSPRDLAALTACALVAGFTLAPAAPAAFTGHSTTVTTTCTGGSSITADGNAYFGQQREAQAWNDVGHETTCSVSPPS